MMVLNRVGLVFIGRRTDGPNTSMPLMSGKCLKAASTENEDPYKAALREL
jgi:hypothetical protein